MWCWCARYKTSTRHSTPPAFKYVSRRWRSTTPIYLLPHKSPPPTWLTTEATSTSPWRRTCWQILIRSYSTVLTSTSTSKTSKSQPALALIIFTNTTHLSSLLLALSLFNRNMDSWIGRTAHIQFLECQPLMKMLVYRYQDFFAWLNDDGPKVYSTISNCRIKGWKAIWQTSSVLTNNKSIMNNWYRYEKWLLTIIRNRKEF